MKQFLKWITLLMLLCCFQAVFATPTTPTSDFIDNGDGTVTHKLTGLVWMRCSMGQTWDKATSNCTGTAATYTWDAAMALKSNFAGKSDWRLPNIAELHTIVERDHYAPALNTVIFPNTDNHWFASSSSYASYNNSAWAVYFGVNGDDYYYSKDEALAVRLVRGEYWSSDSLPLTITTDFIDNKDGTVIHNRTGLVWQRCFMGQMWTGVTCLGTANIYGYNAISTLTSNFANYNDWRIPNINELLSITDYPTFSQEIFPNISANSWVVSSTVYAGNPNSIWIARLDKGEDNYSRKRYSFLPTLLVRGNWYAPVSSNLDLTQANCRYIAPIYNAIWQQMKVKKAPSCQAALLYHTWVNVTRKQNDAASQYYDNRLNNIDTSNQLLTAYLNQVDDGLSIISDVLDPDLRKAFTPAGYQSTVNIFKTKGIVTSLAAGKLPFNASTLKGRILNKALKDKVIGDGIGGGSSNWLCQQLLSGAVADSCSTEAKKIATCGVGLATEGWKGATGCVMGGVTTVTGFINNIFDIGQVLDIKKHNYGYILINDYLNDYYANGSTITSLDEAKLEADIQNYANKLSLSSGGLFTFADFEMQFVKDGIRDSILRNLKTANHNVSLVEQLRAILNTTQP